MDFLKERLHKTGYKQYFIAQKLGVTEKTLNSWLNLKGIDFSIKFMELLNICGIHQCDFLNEYYKTDEFKCEYCKNKK